MITVTFKDGTTRSWDQPYDASLTPDERAIMITRQGEFSIGIPLESLLMWEVQA